MGEPKAVTNTEVRKAASSDGEPGEMWKKIGDISGAGHVPASDEASIDLTEVSDAKREQIEKAMNPEKPKRGKE